MGTRYSYTREGSRYAVRLDAVPRPLFFVGSKLDAQAACAALDVAVAADHDGQLRRGSTRVAHYRETGGGE